MDRMFTHILAATGLLALSGLPAVANEAFALSPPADQRWIVRPHKDNPQAEIRLQSGDGTIVTFILSCTSIRASFNLLNADWSKPQEFEEVIITLAVNGKRVFSGDGSISVTGVETKWVEKQPFLAALRRLKGQTTVSFSAKGTATSKEFVLKLRDDLGFRREADTCAKVMK
jgi:hypothetical protein